MRRTVVLVGVVVAAWCAVVAPARATYGARVTADEPQYLLSAISLAEDRDLDIADERVGSGTGPSTRPASRCRS
jgi:hypothetical protein